MFLMITLIMSDIDSIFELFTLVLKVGTLLFKFPEFVKKGALHLILIASNFLLDFQFLLVLHGTLEVYS